MKKIFLILAIIFSVNARAGLIEIDVSESTLVTGDTVDVILTATDVDPFDLFTFELVFDTGLLDWTSSVVDSELFTSNPFSLFEVNKSANGVAFSFVDFSPVSAGSIELARLTLNSVGAGHTLLSLNDVTFYAPFPSSDILSIDVMQTEVSIAQVSEPTTVLLFAMSLWLVLRLRNNP